ncbi:putative SET domain protein [Leishmania major strain Friedlin]|uniref:Putative SET domain protein n=1 Tax=Leishmania major TaxID=5664 RepID=Q4Q257_LEIMA|nr:putative SET domain protein [Leishmania major strain Friedlin]CAG9583535.1 SET_domain_protein_-_putative [Leishmania major strain Friedlin]CAJ08972.1 putative SET domain protein [Leishmania major strain Friedlin]|eukprot:XP_001686591.1 putative SET domain protein [Leishmania major strain Friedlin]
MSISQRVAVVHDAATTPEQLAAFQRECPNSCDFFPVKDAAQLQCVVQHIHAASPSVYGAVANLYTDRSGDANGGVTSALATLFFQHASLSYTGCRAATLSYPFDVLLMMLFYAGVPLPPFALVDSVEAARRAAHRLKAPVQIRNTCGLLGLCRNCCTVQDAMEETLISAFHEHGKIVAWEVNASKAHAVRVLVAGGSVKGAAAAIPVESCAAAPLWAADAEEAAQRFGAAVSRYVLYDCGVASLTLNTLKENPGKWCFEDLVLNPALPHLVLQEAAPNLLSGAPTAAELVASLLEEARKLHPTPTFELKLHEDTRKGYHLCATKALRKGDVVFEDECRSFAVVTRPHVERHWDGPLKKTFTEYAWPLDSEGHVYAIWEEDPQRWRPINHSCDPNCIFAAPHSLNVIAARDIAAGEDLSMDYATFCDGTMKPFECLCGAACCRGVISADACSLAKYGGHSWLRRVPSAVKPLLP